MAVVFDQMGKEDKCGGPCYNGYERVRLETIYTDTINREKRMGEFSPYYNMNLVQKAPKPPFMSHSHNRQEIIAEKVEKQSPQERQEGATVDAKGYEMDCIHHLLRGPTEKYPIPHTLSHDIGWLLDKPVHAKLLEKTKQPITRTPMLWRNEYKALKKSKSDPLVMAPMLNALNTKRWHKHGNVRSDVHTYAESYYNCMHANPFAKTQPLARGG
jgi:hypothetical protein